MSTIWEDFGTASDPNLEIIEGDDGAAWMHWEAAGIIVDIELPPAALKALAAWVERNPGKENP